MMINIITIYPEGKAIYNCRAKNDDYYHKGREGGGQRVMIEIIISENGDNDGRPLTHREVKYSQHTQIKAYNKQYLL